MRVVNSQLSGGKAVQGGGVFISGVPSSPSYFINSSLSNCEAKGIGGGIYIDENDQASSIEVGRCRLTPG